MNAIVRITAADVNTTVNHEPRIEDRKLGAALGMAQPLNIRQTIEANRVELEGFGSFHAVRENSGRKGGRPSVSYWLNEPQALLLCMFAKTERAAEVRRQIIDVFMAVRHGREVEVRSHKRRVSPVRDATASLKAEIEGLRAMVAEMKGLVAAAVPAPALPVPKGRMPGPFEPGSDILKDLTMVLHTARERMRVGAAGNLGDALIGVLADTRALRDGRPTSGRVMHDWINRKTWAEPIPAALN